MSKVDRDLGKSHLQKAGGIEVGAWPAHRDVKVRASGASCASAQANLLASLHGVAFFHFEFGKMEVQSEKSLAVVDDDAVAFEIQEAGQQHGSGIHGGNRGPGGHAEIEAVMRTLRLAVEDSLRTVDVGDGSLSRR